MINLNKQTQEFIKKFMASETADGNLKTIGKVSQEDINFVKSNKDFILATIRKNKKEKEVREIQNKKEFASFNNHVSKIEKNFMEA